MSKLTDYGLLIVHAMTARPMGERWRMEQLAVETHLPTATVRKCLKLLVDAGVVVSFRGVHGGYQLDRPAEAITLAEVIEAIEGPVQMTECGGPSGGDCELAQNCDLKIPLRSISEVVMAFLHTITLAELSQVRHVKQLLPQPLSLR